MTNISNIRRIQNEITKLNNDATLYEKMFKIDMVGEDIYHWHAILFGPKDSLYDGYQFKLDIILSAEYPFSPPRVKFFDTHSTFKY